MGPTEVDTSTSTPIISEISPPLQKNRQFQFFPSNLQNNNNSSSTLNTVDAPIHPQQQNYAPTASSSASQRQLRSEALRLATFQGMSKSSLFLFFNFVRTLCKASYSHRSPHMKLLCLVQKGIWCHSHFRRPQLSGTCDFPLARCLCASRPPFSVLTISAEGPR